MIDPLSLSIGMGLTLGLLFVEAFGLFAGGMIAPGYIALHLHNPMSVILTLVTALLIYLMMDFLARHLIIYGRRRVAITVLLSFLVGTLVRYGIAAMIMVQELDSTVFTVIGYIIPGLIALSMERQGIIETVTTLITISAAVRLGLIIMIGPVLLQ